MVNAPKWENTTTEDLGVQPKKGYLIIQRTQRHGDIAAMNALPMMVFIFALNIIIEKKSIIN